MEEKEKSAKQETEVDIFRDTLLRYLGYANEVGEAFRSHVPRAAYLASYGVASTYCLADSVSKGLRCYKNTPPDVPTELRRRAAAETTVEAGLWQGLASVVIPGFTINRTCALTALALRKMARPMPPVAQKWLTTLIGLGMIPIIIKPIDRLVDVIMEKTVDASRKLGISHQLDHTKNSHYSHHFK